MAVKKFRSKKAAMEAVDEAQDNGWAAGIMGRGPYFVQATGYAEERTVKITYDLHEDGFMKEYSRKRIPQ